MFKHALRLGGLTAIAQLITLLSTLIITHFYSPKEFNSIFLIITVSLLIMPFATLRLESTVINSTADELDNLSKFLMYWISLASISTTILAFFISNFVLQVSTEQSFQIAFFLGILTLVMSLSLLLVQISYRSLDFLQVGFSSILQTAITATAQILLGILDPSKRSLAIAILAGRILGLIPVIPKRFIFKTIGKEKSIFKKNFLKYFKFSKYLIVGSFLELAQYSIPIILVSSIYGAYAGGIVGMSQTIILAAVSLVGGTFGNVFTAMMSPNASNKKLNSSPFEPKKAMTGLFFPAIMFVGVCNLLMPLIISRFFGPEWVEISGLLKLLSIPVALMMIMNPISNLIYLEKQWEQYYRYTATKLLTSLIATLLAFSMNLTWNEIVFCSYLGGVIGQAMYVKILVKGFTK